MWPETDVGFSCMNLSHRSHWVGPPKGDDTHPGIWDMSCLLAVYTSVLKSASILTLHGPVNLDLPVTVTATAILVHLASSDVSFSNSRFPYLERSRSLSLLCSVLHVSRCLCVSVDSFFRSLHAARSPHDDSKLCPHFTFPHSCPYSALSTLPLPRPTVLELPYEV